MCTKECDGFFKKAGEGDCGEFYRGLGLEYMFDICSDGKVTVQDFEDINVPDVPDVPDTITVPESTPAAVSTDSTSPASQISSADKNGIMLLASLVGAALAFSM